MFLSTTTGVNKKPSHDYHGRYIRLSQGSGMRLGDDCIHSSIRSALIENKATNTGRFKDMVAVIRSPVTLEWKRGSVSTT